MLCPPVPLYTHTFCHSISNTNFMCKRLNCKPKNNRPSIYQFKVNHHINGMYYDWARFHLTIFYVSSLQFISSFNHLVEAFSLLWLCKNNMFLWFSEPLFGRKVLRTAIIGGSSISKYTHTKPAEPNDFSRFPHASRYNTWNECACTWFYLWIGVCLAECKSKLKPNGMPKISHFARLECITRMRCKMCTM